MSSATLCAVCSLPSSNRCAGCGSVYYCGRDHQKSHWKLHKKECKTNNNTSSSSSSSSSSSEGSSGGFFRSANAKDFISSSPQAWLQNQKIPTAKDYEWLIDCYRMRLDDDYAWGGSYLHGLYDPDATPLTIFIDFLLFVRFAVLHSVIPTGYWDWEKFLSIAPTLLPYAFEKSDAKDKYGGENVFSALMGGGRSLRNTGMIVYKRGVEYGSKVEGEEDEDEIETKAMRKIRKQVEEVFDDDHDDDDSTINDLLNENNKKALELFSAVGGIKRWKVLYDNLKTRWMESRGLKAKSKKGKGGEGGGKTQQTPSYNV